MFEARGASQGELASWIASVCLFRLVAYLLIFSRIKGYVILQTKTVLFGSLAALNINFSGDRNRPI